MFQYLKKHRGEWIAQKKLKSLALENGFDNRMIRNAFQRLETRANIGNLWSSERRQVEFQWYPLRKGDRRVQELLDNGEY